MQHEILGPVLPVLTVRKLGAAIHFTNKNKRPSPTYVCAGRSNIIINKAPC
uniref:Uncharacterized protein n=1 Tax=Cairina moschata TaxID=8855 RepID=A0A8C3CP95_CAIMO